MIYDISYINMIGAKPLLISFDKIDGFIRVYIGTSHLVLFDPKKYDAIYNSVIYFLSQKSGITYVTSHIYARTTVDSYSLSPEETWTLHYVKMIINSVFNKNKNNHYHNIFLEKYSH